MELKLITRTLTSVLAIAFSLLLIASCGGGNGTSVGGGNGTGNGTLSVRMADAGATGITAVNVTFTRVEAHVNGNWQVLSTTPMKINLLDLVDTDIVLSQALVPAGNYTQIRLFVDSVTVQDANGMHDCIVPSAAQTGIKVNVDATVNENEITEVLLDFNVNDSIIREGNGTYRMQPVIRGVLRVLSGTISGTVQDAGGPLGNVAVEATYISGPNFPTGTVVAKTFSRSDGHFKLWALLPGTYTVTLVWTNPITLSTEVASVPNVVVRADSNADLGTIVLASL